MIYWNWILGALEASLLMAFHLSIFNLGVKIINFDVWVFTVYLSFIPCCISLSSIILTLSDKKRIEIIYNFVATSIVIVVEFST